MAEVPAGAQCVHGSAQSSLEMVRKSTLRQQMFAREYVIDLNGTRAAIAAGYAESGAHVEASRLLKNPKVIRAIDLLRAKRASKSEVTDERIQQEIECLALANMSDYMEIGEDGKPKGLNLAKLTRYEAAAIQEISEDATGGSGDGERRLIIRTKFKLHSKDKSLELLCRLRGLLKDKMHITGLEGLAERLNEIRKKKNGDCGA